MNGMILFFLALCLLQNLEAAQHSQSKQKFDLSLLHPDVREEILEVQAECGQTISDEDFREHGKYSQFLYLKEAVDAHDCTKIEELIKQGVDVNTCDDSDEIEEESWDKVVLHTAALRGYADVVEALLQAPSLNINRVGVFSNTTTNSQYIKMTPLLLALACGKVVEPKEKGALRDYEKVVELLLKHKACCTVVKSDHDACDDALLFALKHGSLKMVQLLIKAEANIRATSWQGFWDYHTVIKNAIERADVAFVRTVLDAGANPNEYIIKRQSLFGAEPDLLIHPLHHVLNIVNFRPSQLADNTAAAIVEELLFHGAQTDDLHYEKTFAQRLQENSQFAHVYSNVEKRKDKLSAEKLQEVLISNDILLKDLARLAAHYIDVSLKL